MEFGQFEILTKVLGEPVSAVANNNKRFGQSATKPESTFGSQGNSIEARGGQTNDNVQQDFQGYLRDQQGRYKQVDKPRNSQGSEDAKQEKKVADDTVDTESSTESGGTVTNKENAVQRDGQEQQGSDAVMDNGDKDDLNIAEEGQSTLLIDAVFGEEGQHLGADEIKSERGEGEALSEGGLLKGGNSEEILSVDNLVDTELGLSGHDGKNIDHGLYGQAFVTDTLSDKSVVASTDVSQVAGLGPVPGAGPNGLHDNQSAEADINLAQTKKAAPTLLNVKTGNKNAAVFADEAALKLSDSVDNSDLALRHVSGRLLQADSLSRLGSLLAGNQGSQAGQGQESRMSFFSADLNRLPGQEGFTTTAARTGSLQSMVSSDFAQRFAEQIMWFRSQNLQVAEMRLHPRDLGSIFVRVDGQGDMASVNFVAQNQMVRDVLDQSLVKLRELFAEAGLNLLEANVFDQSQQQAEDGEGRQSSGGSSSAELSDEIVLETGAISSQAGNALYLLDFYI